MTRALVTGGAGFVGSHLCEALVGRGDEVVCVDDLSTGATSNLAGVRGARRFRLVERDVCNGIEDLGPVGVVVHLASRASPQEYLAAPLETLRANSIGTMAALELAECWGARFVLASTSEVYGDPHVHPQHEGYWGNVNPVGPRSVYDEAKRFAEALVMAHRRSRGTNTGIVRIFNTYGPRLAPGDGRVVSSFIAQALSGQPITIYGDGRQTRSFCYVDDLISGVVAMLGSDEAGPINLGNPEELPVVDLARLIVERTGSSSRMVFEPLPEDDPSRRQPDVALAAELLGWRPEVGLEEGIGRTIGWQRAQLSRSAR